MDHLNAYPENPWKTCSNIGIGEGRNWHKFGDIFLLICSFPSRLWWDARGCQWYISGWARLL